MLGLLDVDDIHTRWLGGRDRPVLGGIYQEDCEFELKFWILSLLGVCPVELEGVFVGEEGGLLPGP